MASLTLATTVAIVTVGQGTASAAQVGDAGRFDTWTGYEVDRSPIAVVTADFNADGFPDVAWARADWFHGSTPGNTLAVQFNLGDGTMSAVTEYPTTENSTDAAVGDINGDGRPDIVVVAEGLSLDNTTIDLFRNAGDGTFLHSTVTGGSAAQRVALSDIDGNGSLDIATSSGWGATTASVLPNNGGGAFGAERTVDVGAGSLGIAASDLDGDGKADAAVARLDTTTNAPEIVVVGDDAVGNLIVKTRITPPAPADEQRYAPVIAAGDLTGDTVPDLVVTGTTGFDHVVLRNDGGLAFTPLDPVAGSGGSANLSLVDRDGDGDLDVISATQGSSLSGDVSLLRNQGDGTLGALVTIESSHQPTDVATADFNGDGKLDMAVANRGSGTGAIHQQGAGAAFEAPPTYPTFTAPDTVTTADFDQNGSIDVASTVPSSHLVDVKLNTGTGSLTSGSTISSTVGTPTSVWSANLNADTSPDIVWSASGFSPQFGIALNNGDGTFGAPTFVPVQSCGIGRVTTADVNGDGVQDVLVGPGEFGFCSTAANTSVSISINDGAGGFAADTLVPLNYLPSMVLGADVNGDTIVDLVAGSRSSGPGNVAVALGTGGGAFAGAQTYSTGAGHFEIAVADLNGDHAPDIAMTDAGSIESTSVMLNDGDGSFGAPDSYPAEEINGFRNEVAITVGDINGDGRVDLAVANRTGKDMGVHFGHGDGTFDRQQLRYGMHSDLTDIELADMNGDGRLDAVGPTSPPAGAFVSPTRQSSVAAAAASPTGGVSVLVNRAPVVPTAKRKLTVTLTGTGSGAVTSQPAGIACATDCIENYRRGTSVTLTATPSDTSTFAGWSGACTGRMACTLTMSTAKSVTARFTKLGSTAVTLTAATSGRGSGSVTSTKPGIACPTDCTQNYKPGTKVTLTPAPATGSHFVGWSGACLGTTSCTVTMDAPKKATARFARG